MKLHVLVDLIRLTARTTAQFICSAVAKGLVHRLPPQNWNHTRPVVPALVALRSGCEIQYAPVRRGDSIKDSAFDSQVEGFVNIKPLDSDSDREKEVIVLENVPVIVKISKIAVEVGVGGDVLPHVRVHLEGIPITPVKPSRGNIVETEFSIYTPISSPNKAMYITPIRSPLLTAREVNFTALKAASERVSEILRENRRRLDAGEDPSTVRKAARRRRAQELSATRKLCMGL